MENRNDNLPFLGLAAAAFALILIPALKLMEPRPERVIDPGPEYYNAAARDIDAFWTRSFSAQFPSASEPYRTPKVSFAPAAEQLLIANADVVGVYRPDAESIRVLLHDQPAFVILTIAHEFGHHVQKLGGWADHRDSAAFGTLPGEGRRQLGVRYELQAECLAGVWAHYAVRKGTLVTTADVKLWQAGMAFGSDSETHGAATQQLNWFNAGYQSGSAASCDTFAPEWTTL